MRLQTVLALPCLAAVALAETHRMSDSFTQFNGISVVPDKEVTGEVYTGCRELDENGRTVSTHGVCVANLLRNMFLALAATSEEEKPVFLAMNNTILDTQLKDETSSIASSTNALSQSVSGSYDVGSEPEQTGRTVMLLKRTNEHISGQSGSERAMRAVQDDHSGVHPKDGVEVPTNIHGDDAVLHVHTNGSHAVAQFRRSTPPELSRRDGPFTQRKYQFEGVKGLKMQIKWASREPKCHLQSDLSIFASAFAYGNGKDEPPFKKSDSWKFAVCDKEGKKMFQGKLISLESPSDYGYEGGDDSVDCK